jgi:Cu-Zn family superoxide dismutase
MKAVRPAFATLLLAAAGCATTNDAPAGNGDVATAAIHDASGRTVANARLEQAGAAIRVHVESAGLAAGNYGTHVHAVGLCEPPGFTTAGAHWNPTGRQHGSENPQGAHLGDLPNLVVDASGRGSVDFSISSASIASGSDALLDADGAAIVIHAQADDYRTDPSGNSGARIACGILGRG